jgi:ABC-type glutathione transport system ATPase component
MSLDHHFAEVTSTTAIKLSFADVRYTVATSQGPRTLLHGVSGRVQPGQCCAILGSSGSGTRNKVTFMNKK